MSTPNETPLRSPLWMDRDGELGNSEDNSGRRALHVKNMAQLITSNWDTITTDYPDTITEIYNFRTGGVIGPILDTITVVYMDGTKALINYLVKS